MPRALSPAPDPAAVFAIALSLWEACHAKASFDRSIDLSNAHTGMDGFIRAIMRIAQLFESWACQHIDFTQLSDVWPYLLQDRFVQECLSILLPNNLADFDEHDCRRIATRLNLKHHTASDFPPKRDGSC